MLAWERGNLRALPGRSMPCRTGSSWRPERPRPKTSAPSASPGRAACPGRRSPCPAQTVGGGVGGEHAGGAQPRNPARAGRAGNVDAGRAGRPGCRGPPPPRPGTAPASGRRGKDGTGLGRRAGTGHQRRRGDGSGADPARRHRRSGGRGCRAERLAAPGTLGGRGRRRRSRRCRGCPREPRGRGNRYWNRARERPPSAGQNQRPAPAGRTGGPDRARGRLPAESHRNSPASGPSGKHG